MAAAQARGHVASRRHAVTQRTRSSDRHRSDTGNDHGRVLEGPIFACRPQASRVALDDVRVLGWLQHPTSEEKGSPMFDIDAAAGKRTDDEASHPQLFYLCGVVGICGCVVVVLANIVGVLVQPKDGLVADTISDLAAGRYAVIMDIGLYAFAAVILARAAGLRRLHWGKRSWTAGSWLLTLMAVMIVVIGAYGEYGDNDVGGLVIHLPLVLAMALTFTASALLTAAGFYRYRRRWFWFNIACAVLWVLGAACFWFSPTTIDGLIERLVGSVMVVWLFALSKLLIDRSKGKATSLPGFEEPDPA